MPLMERRQDKRPFGLIIAVSVALFAGLVSIPLQVYTFQQVGAASKADIERNRELVEQVRALEEANGENVQEHRERNQEDHNALCDLIKDIARQAGLQADGVACGAPLPR